MEPSLEPYIVIYLRLRTLSKNNQKKILNGDLRAILELLDQNITSSVTRVELWLQFGAKDSVGRMILQTSWKSINGS